MNTSDRIYLYDTTLRDGAQTYGVDFSTAEKAALAQALDEWGMDYIEGGWPGANPTDDALFESPPVLHHAKLTAFGMTKRRGQSAANDPGLSAVLNSGARHFCLVGKTWDHQVLNALGLDLEENLENIQHSMAIADSRGEAHFDAEHFFDGYKANPEYAMRCLRAALDGGARWVVLCDTNGGTLPHEVNEIVHHVAAEIPGDKLGIHTHDDTGNAIANTLEAVRAGCRLVQGTLNGLGERCGNANLVALIPTLALKMGFATGLSPDSLKNLGDLSRKLDEILNREHDPRAPYIGERAFVHKGGLHASGVQKDPASYEHVDPALVGNRRTIAVSDQAGRSNILARFRDLGIEVDPDDQTVRDVVDQIKQMEAEGYAFESAAASLEVLVQRKLGHVPEFFTTERFSVKDEQRFNVLGQLVTESEATVKIAIDGTVKHSVSEGNGPVNALDNALRKALKDFYPQLEPVQLADYRVRILKPNQATAAVTRVWVETRDRLNPGAKWHTLGVSGNIISASYQALCDSYIYKLLRDRMAQVSAA